MPPSSRHASSNASNAPVRVFPFQSLMIGCLPKKLGPAPAVSQLPRRTPNFLHAFNTANAGRQIGAEETAVGGLVCEPDARHRDVG